MEKDQTSESPHAASDVLIAEKLMVKLEKIMEEHNYQRSALLEVLQKAQEIFGYLDRKVLLLIAEKLHVAPSQVYGAATFYNFFRLRKPGEHIITICMGTACYVKGADKILSTLEQELGIERGKSTPDGRISLFITRCIGACAMAPNVIIDDVVIGKATKEGVIERIRKSAGGEN
ncbi:MAG: NAD(P)H-dependent oxidoreductase subunit E [Methanomassiliicoccales archaeon]|nr:NAD(P)H-dependent oxidoreductase subunit E [Methanomassiliicoccales archaeon]